MQSTRSFMADSNAHIDDAAPVRDLTAVESPEHSQIVVPELERARAEIMRLNAELKQHAIERTDELAINDNERREETSIRHRAEQALESSEERLQCYFELGLVGMATASPTRGFLDVNDHLCEILGYKRLELLNMRWVDLLYSDDLANDTINCCRVLGGDIDSYSMPKRWIRKNGVVVYTNMSVRCQRSENGSVDFFVAMIQEIAGSNQNATGSFGADREEPRPRSIHKRLSHREQDVVEFIGAGKSVKEIAGVLGLSEKTVSTYRSRILIKLKLTTTAEIIRYALRNCLAA